MIFGRRSSLRQFRSLKVRQRRSARSARSATKKKGSSCRITPRLKRHQHCLNNNASLFPSRPKRSLNIISCNPKFLASPPSTGIPSDSGGRCARNWRPRRPRRQHGKPPLDRTRRSLSIHAPRPLPRPQSPPKTHKLPRRRRPGRRSRKRHRLHRLHHGTPRKHPRRAMLSCQTGNNQKRENRITGNSNSSSSSSEEETRPVHYHGTLQQARERQHAMH